MINYLKELLEDWQKTNIRGKITVIRLESWDIDVIPAPHKRFRKEDVKKINTVHYKPGNNWYQIEKTEE